MPLDRFEPGEATLDGGLDGFARLGGLDLYVDPGVHGNLGEFVGSSHARSETHFKPPAPGPRRSRRGKPANCRWRG